MKSRILSIIFSLILAVSFLAVSACNKPDNQTTEDVFIEKLEFDESNVLFTLGDVAELGVTYNEIEGETLKWSSSNSSIAQVDSNGKVEAKKVGTAIINVAYGTKTANCRVQVSTNGNIPVLAFDNDVDENLGISLCKNTTFGFGTHVLFNGKTFNDAEIEYLVSDPDIGQVIDDEFVSNNVIGETDVTIYATWRNQFVSSKTIKVSVVSDKSVILNNGEVKDINLYTASSHEGKSYLVSQDLTSVSITEDGNPVNEFTISIIDNNIASVEENSGVWTITAKKAGKTYAVVSYNGIDGKTDVPFSVNVNYPVAVYGEKLLYSVNDGMLYSKKDGMLKTANTFFEGFGDIKTVKVDNKTFTVTDNIIKNVNEGKGQVFTVYNGSVGYEITADAYTMVLDELKDFENIYSTTEALKSTLNRGSYALAKDLISPSTILTMPEGKVSADFGGTFDGMGHVVSCTLYRGDTGNFGLFGAVLCGATIKNIAIDNTTIDGNTSSVKVAGVICSEPSQAANNLYTETTLENVYVNVKFSSKGQVNLALMGNVQWNTVLKNVIVVANDVPEGVQYGAFARGATKKNTDSYVISNSVLYYTQDNPTLKFSPVPDAFETFNDLKNSGKDFSGFSPEYWNLSKGVPVWHSLVEGFSLNAD